MAKVLIGNRILTIDDSLRIAASKHKVVLDTATLQKVRAAVPKGRPAASTLVPSTAEVAPDTALPPVTTRAILTMWVSTIMQARSGVRAEVAMFLSNLLNADITPLLPAGASDAQVATALFTVMAGHGACLYSGRAMPTRDALAAATQSLLVPPLTDMERSVLSKLDTVVTATGIVEAHTAETVLLLADATVATTCEAVQGNTAPFKEMMESARAHQGQVASATNIRSMMESSQLHGPAADAVQAAQRTLRTELNSADVAPTDASAAAPGPSHPAPVHAALAAMVSTMCPVARASVERLHILAAAAADLAGTNALADAFPADAVAGEARTELRAMAEAALSITHTLCTGEGGSETVARALEQAVPALHRILCLELLSACYLLIARRADMEERARAKLEAKAAAAAAAPAAHAPPAGDAAAPAAPAASDAAELKREAKRAAKAAKAAQKAAQKAEKQARGLVLGVGTRRVLERVEAAVRVTAGAPSLHSPGGRRDPAKEASALLRAGRELAGALSLLDLTPDGTPAFLYALFAELASGGAARKPKLPKGTRDYLPEQMSIREQCFRAIRAVFKRHGAVEIDTPVFELKSTLTGKYGEDSKLIYDLADQGGELLSLRYDLTVPFARFLALHNLGNVKRFHIARVYRRDNPAMNRGRFREFYQCDFDIAGTYGRMVPDAEVIAVGCEILSSLPIGQFAIKLNHRMLLDAMMARCGVPAAKFRPICSAIDKLDKEPWEVVRSEMVHEKGLPEAAADSIGRFVALRGEPMALLRQLTEGGDANEWFGGDAVAGRALEDLKLLFDYLDAMGWLERVSFDLSLARGLDYYTGVIYEAVLTDGTSQVGSIAAGGRYDNLVGMFSRAGSQTPCVGISIGIERVFAIMEERARRAGALKAQPVEVLVASIGAGMMRERLHVCRQLWDGKIAAETLQQDNLKLVKQLNYALEANIPFMVVFGEDELRDNMVKVKDMALRTEDAVPRDRLVQVLQERGCGQRVDTGAAAAVDPQWFLWEAAGVPAAEEAAEEEDA